MTGDMFRSWFTCLLIWMHKNQDFCITLQAYTLGMDATITSALQDLSYLRSHHQLRHKFTLIAILGPCLQQREQAVLSFSGLKICKGPLVAASIMSTPCLVQSSQSGPSICLSKTANNISFASEFWRLHRAFLKSNSSQSAVFETPSEFKKTRKSYSAMSSEILNPEARLEARTSLHGGRILSSEIIQTNSGTEDLSSLIELNLDLEHVASLGQALLPCSTLQHLQLDHNKLASLHGKSPMQIISSWMHITIRWGNPGGDQRLQILALCMIVPQ